MIHRQTDMPTEWLMIGRRSDACWRSAVRHLPRGTGVLVLGRDFSRGERSRIMMQLRRISKVQGLVLVNETSAHAAARVHHLKELRQALSARTALILLSPMFPTRSHPDWKPLPRMRAAALARLSGRRAIALGGMDRQRFARIEKLGFAGWAGIDAWTRT